MIENSCYDCKYLPLDDGLPKRFCTYIGQSIWLEENRCTAWMKQLSPKEQEQFDIENKGW